MKSSVYRLQTFNSPSDLIQIQTEGQAHRRAGQRVVYHMLTRNGNNHIKIAGRRTDGTGRPLQAPAFYSACMDGMFFLQAEKYRRFPLYLLHSSQLVIISVENHRSLTLQVIENLCLRPENPVPVSQIFQMAAADIGDHTDIRSCNGSQPMHLAKITDSHLQYRNLILLAQPEHRQGKPQLIVEISLCFQYPVLLGQYGSNGLFGAGLPHASGDSHHRDIQLFQIICRNIFHCLQRGLYTDHRIWRVLQILFRKGSQRPRFHHLGNKIMAIRPTSHNGHKQTPRFRLSAVCGNGGHTLLPQMLRPLIGSAARGGNIFQRQIFHDNLPSYGSC